MYIYIYTRRFMYLFVESSISVPYTSTRVEPYKHAYIHVYDAS